MENINITLSNEQISEFAEMFKKRASEQLAKKYNNEGYCYLVMHNRKSEKDNNGIRQVLVFNYSANIPDSTLRNVIWGKNAIKSERVQCQKIAEFKRLISAILHANGLENNKDNIEKVLKVHHIIASSQVIDYLAN